MYTYEQTKMRGLETITHAVMGLASSNNHEANKQLLRCIADAVDLLVWLESLNSSFEAGDLQGMRKAKSDYENRHTMGV